MSHCKKKCKSDEYDYIIVGCGTSGTVVGYNLMKAGYKVCILEQGAYLPNDRNLKILNRAVNSWNNPGYKQSSVLNYRVQSLPAKYASQNDMGLFDNLAYPRAATLGGCSAHNAGVCYWGDQYGYDKWATELNNQIWNSNNIISIVNSILNVSGSEPESWLEAQIAPLTPLDDTILNVLMNKGLIYRNFAIPEQSLTGVGQYPTAYTLEKGIPIRNSAFNIVPKSYREKFLKNVKFNSTCTRVLFNSNNKAIGVEYLEKKYTNSVTPLLSDDIDDINLLPRKKLYARKEVILCGGGFQTPQLLLLSGIGPQNDLNNLNIPIIVNSPMVGNGVTDHYEVSLIHEFNYKNNIFTKEDLAKLPSFHGLDINYHPSDLDYEKCDYPGDENTPLLHIISFQAFFPDFDVPTWRPNPDYFYHTFEIALTFPLSTSGTIKLRNTNPFNRPYITYQLNDCDINVLVEGIKLGRCVWNSSAIQNGYNDIKEVIPGEEYQTDEDLRKFVINDYYGHHVSCGARMGSDSDSINNSVCNSVGLVRGVTGLRVVDTSAFPYIPAGNTMMPAFIIGQVLSNQIINSN